MFSFLSLNSWHLTFTTSCYGNRDVWTLLLFTSLICFTFESLPLHKCEKRSPCVLLSGSECFISKSWKVNFWIDEIKVCLMGFLWHFWEWGFWRCSLLETVHVEVEHSCYEHHQQHHLQCVFLIFISSLILMPQSSACFSKTLTLWSKFYNMHLSTEFQELLIAEYLVRRVLYLRIYILFYALILRRINVSDRSWFRIKRVVCVIQAAMMSP